MKRGKLLCYNFVVSTAYALQKCIDDFPCAVNDHLEDMGTFNLKNRIIHCLLNFCILHFMLK
jgi:hypothetical protein